MNKIKTIHLKLLGSVWQSIVSRKALLLSIMIMVITIIRFYFKQSRILRNVGTVSLESFVFSSSPESMKIRLMLMHRKLSLS